MPAVERISESNACDLSSVWMVDPDVMARVVRAAVQMEAETGQPVWIISGARSESKQDELRRRGRPTAAPGVSTHTSCPATGVDVRIGFLPTKVTKIIWGRIAVFEGLRWGGGSKVDPQTGIPSDWNHVDVGPRR